jgi:hypothetical protein
LDAAYHKRAVLVDEHYGHQQPMGQEMIAKSPIPISLQYVMLYLGLSIEILRAIFMLRAASWARLLYIAWGAIGLLFGLLASPDKPILIPGILMYAIFVFFLLRPKASAYFTHSENVPNQKPGKWLK